MYIKFCSDCTEIETVWFTLTRPRPLSRQSEAVALRVGVADVGGLSGAVHRQHAALLAVGRPAAVVHVAGGPHGRHHSVI